ncbi:hypothetical protein LSH36_3034g00007, partial [Paralvinella palmiformis]
KPDGTKNIISEKHITHNSIEIEWQHLTGITEILKEYYGYLIQYKDDTTGGSYIEDVRVNYTSSSYWKIENLNSCTDYSIEIKPFRMFDNYKDYGYPYPVLQVKTRCGDSPCFSTYYITVIVILLGIIVTLAVFLWKSRQQIKQTPSKNIQDLSQLEPRMPPAGISVDMVDDNSQVILSDETVQYEPVSQNTSTNPKPIDVDAAGICLHEHQQPASYSELENNDITQYEDIKGHIPEETGQNTYEGLSDEVRVSSIGNV